MSASEKKFFMGERYAREWLEHAERDRALLEFTVELFAPRAGELVLEVGSGEGRFTHLLAERGSYICGVDLNVHLLRRNQRRRDKDGGRVELMAADAQFLPIRDRVFHRGFSIGTLYYITDIGKTIKGLARVVRSSFLANFDNSLNLRNLAHSVKRGLLQFILVFLKGILRRHPFYWLMSLIYGDENARWYLEHPLIQPSYNISLRRLRRILEDHGFQLEVKYTYPHWTNLTRSLSVGWIINAERNRSTEKQ